MDPIRRSVLFTLLLLAFLPARAADLKDQYQEIRPPLPAPNDGRIEVMEIFWYGCPHCYAFEPYLDKWAETKPDYVELKRVPGVLSQGWLSHARAFYTAQKLGVLDKIHQPLFDAIHRDRKPIYSEDALKNFFEAHGVSGTDFERVYDSNEVDVRLKQALVIARSAKITGVPAIIVNGKYLVTGTTAGSFEGMIDVMNRLIEQEHAVALN